MPKQLLSGSLEEQCDFLVEVALQKMEQGNFTGAAYALKEVVKHAPDFRDAAGLLAQANRHKAEQRLLLFSGLGGLALFVAIGSVRGVANDLYLLVLAALGTVVGYGVGNLVNSFRRRGSA